MMVSEIKTTRSFDGKRLVTTARAVGLEGRMEEWPLVLTIGDKMYGPKRRENRLRSGELIAMTYYALDGEGLTVFHEEVL